MKELIAVVANARFKYAGVERTPPPNREPGRAKSYTFELDPRAAAPLAKRGLVAPAFEDDAFALKKRGGVVADSWYRNYAPKESVEEPESVEESVEKPTEEPEMTSEEPDEELVEIVHDALSSGLKADLVDALTLVGLDPESYSNNDERSEALESWLGED